MAIYTQADRPLRVTTPLGFDRLLLTALEGRESISRLYQFRLELLAPRYADVPFDALLGKPVTALVAFPGQTERCFHGIVNEFRQLGSDDAFDHYQCAIVPKFWLWTKRFRSRVFQQQTVPQILLAVLDGLEVSFDLSANYFARDYCVQYAESDFHFASRLMEEEGMYYYFQHAEDGHRMVVTDSPFQLPDIAEPKTIQFEQIDGARRNQTRVGTWTKTQRICGSKTTLWDCCFELPGQNLEAVEGVQQTLQAGSITHNLPGSDLPLEHYEFPGRYAQRFDGVTAGGQDNSGDLANIFQDNVRTAKVRMEQEAAGSVRIDATGNCAHLLPGHKFSLSRHDHADGEYLLTEIEHQARLRTGYRVSAEEDALDYENRFVCQPASLPYRPARITPRPQITGPQTATVVGPAGQEIFVDKYGRIKVQFYWDREGQHSANSSCWIRVSQLWAGPRWGAFFWPRVGHEVVVAFEEGDPDRPIVVGSVYNAANMPPLELPDNNMRGGIKSCIFGGDPARNFNAVLFHDNPDDEYVQIHSEHHQMTNTENDQYQLTPQSQYGFYGHLL